MERPLSIRKMGCRVVFLLLLALAGGVPVGGVTAAQDPSAPVSMPEGASLQSDTLGAGDCQKLAALLEQQKQLISRETGQLKREIAALRDDLSKPGIQEIFAGVGYIFGLAGIGIYVHTRRQSRSGGERNR